jgi:glyoxylase-like metal-dependent hydrolase (beta-lactamase superfamily II)
MIRLNRRQFVESSAAAVVLGGAMGSLALPPSSRGEAPFMRRQAPGFHRSQIGQFEIIALSDGFFELPSESIATNAPPEERKNYFETRFIPQDKFRLQATPLLINTGQKLVLVDAGVGPKAAWAPGAGRLAESLSAAGIGPDAIDTVVITHAHSDHIGGLVDLATGAPRFPKAEVVLSDVELDLWTASDAANRLPEWAAQGLQNQQKTFHALRDRLRTIKAGSDVMTGIQGLPTPGHTPGHLSLLIGSGNEQLLLTGDAIASIHIAFERPAWQIMWDHDREQGAQTRARLLDRVATDRVPVAGYHYPFPGVGHVVRDGSAYRWLPTDWSWSH